MRDIIILTLCNAYKGVLQQRLAAQLGAFADDVHLIDGLPMPLCCFGRAPGCRSFSAAAAYGYCAANKQTYYGFHGHLLVSRSGVSCGFSLTAANNSEREALWDVIAPIQALLIGDKGYLTEALAQALLDQQIVLKTPLRSNMQPQLERSEVKLLPRVRRLIERVIAQLVEPFDVEKVRARYLWHLTSRLNLKLLAHTVCFWLNRLHPEPLQFDELVTEN